MYLDEGENITRFAINKIFMGTAVSLVLKILMVFVDGGKCGCASLQWNNKAILINVANFKSIL